MVKERRNILLVDTNRRNQEMLGQFLQNQGYTTVAASTLEEFDQALLKTDNLGIALVDLAGFDRNIWQRCEQLWSKQIPFLVLSPRQSAEIQKEGLLHGARGILVKPLLQKELLGLVKGLMGE